MARRRIDSLLTERGIFPSRSAAATSVRAGEVRLGAQGPVVMKPSQLIETDAELSLQGPRRFVSRGGEKLQNAIDSLELDVRGRACLDVGASTGGFSDCLLKNGAARVVSLDVGHGQIDWTLRQDPRVSVIERKNARGLRREELPFAPQLITVDVSFISLRKVLPALVSCLGPRGELLALVKPQFELGRERVGRGGVVRSASDRRDALFLVGEAAQELGLAVRACVPSGLAGPKGNRESFIWCAQDGAAATDLEETIARVEA